MDMDDRWTPPHNSTEYVLTEENIPTTQFSSYNESVRVANAFQSQIKPVSCVFYLHDLILTFFVDLVQTEHKC